MDTRVVVLAALASCAGPARYDAGPAPQVTAGATDEFGGGLSLARPSGVHIDLTVSAYVAIARFGAIETGELVYPLEGPDWLDYGYPARGEPELPLEPGRHRLDVPLPWLRIDIPPASRRASPGDGCRYKDNAWACTSWGTWRFQENHPELPYYSRLPTPDSLVEHHLVVLVSASTFDAAQLRARLDELHETRVTATAAAAAAPYFLTARHEGAWAAFATTVRIKGVL